MQIRATREVILSAGVIGTPRLLEMSGIGDKDVLDNAGIRTRIALPGVGNNLQDHYVVRLGYRVRGAGTANERSHGLALAREMMRYVLSGTGVLTYSAAIVDGFKDSRLADGSSLNPRSPVISSMKPYRAVRPRPTKRCCNTCVTMARPCTTRLARAGWAMTQ